MGRKKIYTTDKDRRLAKNKHRMDYYWRHQDVEQKRSLKRYYERKNSIL